MAPDKNSIKWNTAFLPDNFYNNADVEAALNGMLEIMLVLLHVVNYMTTDRKIEGKGGD
jgi:hypothetical protein